VGDVIFDRLETKTLFIFIHHKLDYPILHGFNINISSTSSTIVIVVLEQPVIAIN
jgi:hypothetical protein